MRMPLGPESRWWGHTLEHRILLYLLSLATQQGKKRGQVKVSTDRLVKDCTWDDALCPAIGVGLTLKRLYEAGEISASPDIYEAELTIQLLKYDEYGDARKSPPTPCPDADQLLKLWEESIGPVPRKSAQQRAFRQMLLSDSKTDSSITPENVEAIIHWLPSQIFPPGETKQWRGWGWICKTPVKLKEHWSALLKSNGNQGVWEYYLESRTARIDRETTSQTVSLQAQEAFDGYEV